MREASVTVRITGNSPKWGYYEFPAGVTLGEVFDHVGGFPREPFPPSHTIAVRRRHRVKPHSIHFDLSSDGWRGFGLIDKDIVIYQYNLKPAEKPKH
jgi:hypothetical protein